MLELAWVTRMTGTTVNNLSSPSWDTSPAILIINTTQWPATKNTQQLWRHIAMKKLLCYLHSFLVWVGYLNFKFCFPMATDKIFLTDNLVYFWFNLLIRYCCYCFLRWQEQRSEWVCKGGDSYYDCWVIIPVMMMLTCQCQPGTGVSELRYQLITLQRTVTTSNTLSSIMINTSNTVCQQRSEWVVLS